MEAGRAVVKKKKKKIHAFHWLSPCQERKGGLSSSCWAWELPLLVSWLFNWGFCLLILYLFPFWSSSFSESITDQESGFPVSVAFYPSVPGRTFPGGSVSCGKESVQIGNLLRLCWSNKEGWERALSSTFFFNLFFLLIDFFIVSCFLHLYWSIIALQCC